MKGSVRSTPSPGLSGASVEVALSNLILSSGSRDT